MQFGGDSIHAGSVGDMASPPCQVESAAHDKKGFLMRRLMVVASLLALVAAACKIETNFGVAINADGTGTIVAEVGFDEEAAGFFLEGDTDPFEGNDLSDCPGARTSEETRGDMTFYIIECDVDDLAELQDAALEGENSLLSDFQITVTDDLITVTGSASAEESLGDDVEGFDPATLEDSFSANLLITMPGRILEHNADSQDGNTLKWAIPILGGTLDVSASSDPKGSPAGGGGGGIPVWLIAVIAVVVLGAGYWLMTQKKGGGAAPAAAGEGDFPPPPPPTE